MSGSPKYCQAELDRQRQRELEERRRQAAEAEARLRREQEDRRRREALAKARAQAREELNRLQQKLAVHRGASYTRFAESELETLDRGLKTLLRSEESVQDLASVQRVAAETGALGRRLEEVAARARAAETAERLQREMERKAAEAESGLAGAQAMLEGFSADQRVKFDPEAARSIEKMGAEIRQGIAAKRYDEAIRTLRQLSARITTHLQTVAEAHARWETQRQEAMAAHGELAARFEGLKADPVVMAWVGPRVRELEGKMDLLQALLRQEDWRRAVSDCQAAVETIDALISEAQKRQLQEDKRRYIVNGILKVLQKQEFSVGEPGLVLQGNYDSDVVIHAWRPDRRAIEVKIPVEGNVAYKVDGWAMRQEAGADGRPAATCDEAEERLIAINAQLENEFGIKMGELQWEGRDPKRIRKGAKELPGSGGQANKARGGGPPGLR